MEGPVRAPEARERRTSHHDARPCSHQPPGVTRQSSGERHIPSAAQSASVSASGGAQPSLRSNQSCALLNRLCGVSDHADIMIRCGVTAGHHPCRPRRPRERLPGWTSRANGRASPRRSSHPNSRSGVASLPSSSTRPLSGRSRTMARAVSAGATEVYPVSDEHGWRLGRIEDPFGHHWEIGKPLHEWPPACPGSRRRRIRRLTPENRRPCACALGRDTSRHQAHRDRWRLSAGQPDA